MSRFNDLADYILHNQSRPGGTSGTYSSGSEAEDIPEALVELPEDYLDKKKNTNVAIKLHELGPRMRMKLVKIEENFCRGNVVFHKYIKLDRGEIKKQMDALKSKRELKASRKKLQEANIKKK